MKAKRMFVMMLYFMIASVFGCGGGKAKNKNVSGRKWKPKHYGKLDSDYKDNRVYKDTRNTHQDPLNGTMLAEIPGKAKLFRITKKQNEEFFEHNEADKKLSLYINEDDDFKNLEFLNDLLFTRQYSRILKLMEDNKKEESREKFVFESSYQQSRARFGIFWNMENRDFTEAILLEAIKFESGEQKSLKEKMFMLAAEKDLTRVCEKIPSPFEQITHQECSICFTAPSVLPRRPFPKCKTDILNGKYFIEAVKNNSLKCTEIIMKKMENFDVKVPDKWNQLMDPLEFVAKQTDDWSEMCETLLKNQNMKALLQKQYGTERKTPLMLAADLYESPNPKVVECLAEHVKNENQLDSVDRFGITALRHAVFRGHGKVCEILLEKGADVKGTYGNGLGKQTLLGNAIYTAIREESLGCLTVLLKHGAAVNEHYTANGDTTHLHLASGYRGGEICKLLLKYGAKTDVLGTQSNFDFLPITPLMMAITNRNRGCVEAILGAGADLDMESGQLPYDKEFFEEFQNKSAEYFAENTSWKDEKNPDWSTMIYKYSSRANALNGFKTMRYFNYMDKISEIKKNFLRSNLAAIKM